MLTREEKEAIIKTISDSMTIADLLSNKELYTALGKLMPCDIWELKGGFIPLIKAYRVLTNAGLKDAKDFVEQNSGINYNSTTPGSIKINPLSSIFSDINMARGAIGLGVTIEAI